MVHLMHAQGPGTNGILVRRILTILIGALITGAVGLGGWALSGVADTKTKITGLQGDMGYAIHRIDEILRKIESHSNKIGENSYDLLQHWADIQNNLDKQKELRSMLEMIIWRIDQIERNQWDMMREGGQEPPRNQRPTPWHNDPPYMHPSP